MSASDYSDTTVIVPVRDEPATGKVVNQVFKSMPGAKVLVIYKGRPNISAKRSGLTIVAQRGSGKGTAVIQAARLVKTPIMCIIDGDATYDVNDLKKAADLVKGGADMVTGNRMNKVDSRAMPGYIRFGNRVLSWTCNRLYNTHLIDSQTGLRAIRKSAFDKIEFKETHFGIETEMAVKFKKKNFKLVEIPINYYERIGETKHVKGIGGIKLFFTMFKFLFE